MDKLLLHVGPTTIKEDVLIAGLDNNVGFTSKEFVEAFRKSLEGLRYVMGVSKKYQPFIIPGGGTSAMESVTSLLKKDDKVLVLSNGVFGDRWEQIFKRYPVSVKVVRPLPGEYVNQDLVLEEVQKENYKMVTLTHVETSTGVREPVKEVVEKIRKYVDLVVVDGVSSVGAEEVKAEEWNIDVYLTASQKALGCPAGLGLLVLSPKANELLNNEDSIAGYYLNLRNWLPVMRNMEEGKASYFSTLPVHVILQLAKAFDLIREEGIENRVKRHALVSSAIRAGVEALGLEITAKKPASYSNTVTGVVLKKTDPQKVLAETINEGVEFAPGVHPAFRYFRIGHMGWVTPNDAVVAISVIERVLRKLGEPIRFGEGVKAVQDVISSAR
ncbi:septum site-determining protein [Sulfolobus sp. A20]|uniref:pyridoxal-phosphate-dependent aminotransferase family protein n=1 Tax=Sulfolobaceae TaxID=118883 RepID=UPI000845DE90|nr:MULTISPECIES: alanine--glyoxylate aminotransferase family protein [unclassified Sulfolobus]TRM78723.1 aminotransferase class V-fold PLP-dependent enzyme [Sulfolobus sp. A20-N-F8]TRM87908.1 aminotransferase class V-fold PLP-dependent enzyme [Sulfolobus sp. C3]TRM95536.1 aminotransferase class V-fold PLP-dependent enzyme [Sulfolobus sp. A20-N-G8]TRM98412.1 aminotransferase class V-fold PLP-dependent enzyme [Sulfolobus sp. F1]AOL16884.1 septum site-determining protein [Sulfolobus sp. A20]